MVNAIVIYKTYPYYLSITYPKENPRNTSHQIIKTGLEIEN